MHIQEHQADSRITECLQSKQCAPLKHHYDECAERVKHQEETHGKAEEDCVEECKSMKPYLSNMELWHVLQVTGRY